MKLKRTGVVVAAALALTVLAACSGNGEAADSSVGEAPATAESSAGSGSSSNETPAGETTSAKLGLALTLTGFGATIGEMQKNAIDLAVNDLKADGVVLDIVSTQDAGGTTSSALNAIRRVLSEDPDVIVGPFSGSMQLAIRPEIERAQIPELTIAGTRSVTQNDNKFIYRFSAHDGITKHALATYAAEELGVKKPAILYDTLEYGQVGKKILEEEISSLGQTVAAEVSIEPDATDATGQAHKIVDSGADAVEAQVTAGTTGAVALKELRRAGFDGEILWASGVTNPAMLDLLTAADVEGVYAENIGYLDPEDPEAKDVADRFRDQFGVDLDVFSAITYDSVMMIGQAVANGASGPDGIGEALSTMDYQGIVADYRCDTEGNMNHTGVILKFGKDKQTTLQKTYTVDFTPRS